MTEAEWLACTDPVAMLDCLRGRASQRKLRLFAVGCCRRLGPMLGEDVLQKAIKVGERQAEGLPMGCALAVAQDALRQTREGATRRSGVLATQYACEAVVSIMEDGGSWFLARSVLRPAAWAAARYAEGDGEHHAIWDSARADEHAQQCAVIRDLFTFNSPPTCDDSVWRTSTVSRLALALYLENRFSELGILADALEEAGCDAAELLIHLRSPGLHLRGCWALDALLGKK